MKKYGKKWRKLHPELASKQRANDIEQMQEQKRLRQTPWDQKTIVKLRKKAYAQISAYQKKEAKERSFERWTEKRLKRCILRNSNIAIDSNFIYTVFPFVTPLKNRLKHNASEFIQRVNAIFEISVANISSYLFLTLEYDIETHGIEPIGKFYIDTLCVVLEDSTWYTRKNRNLIFEKIKEAFTKSEFIKSYRVEKEA